MKSLDRHDDCFVEGHLFECAYRLISSTRRCSVSVAIVPFGPICLLKTSRFSAHFHLVIP